MENQSRDSKFELSVLGAVWTVVFYTLIIPVLIGPFYMIYDSIPFGDMENTKEIIGILGNIILRIIIVILVFKNIKKNRDENFKIEYMGKLNYKLLLSVILLIMGYYLWYQSSIGIIMDKVPLEEWIKEVEREMELHPYYEIFYGATVAPIFEEIFMRGIILAGLLSRYSPKKAIIISALIFGIWHFNIHQSVNATLIGIILGIIYYKTNSLILCITLHMTNNIFAMIMGVAKEYMGYSPNIISFVVGVIIFIGSAILFFQYLKGLDEKLEMNKLYEKQEVL
ncbi:MAG: CPBP family intramembrane glutamic endopeptidase [Psychrilyobacter sp.]|uniref:CPBP family intramembrane glutamic endopeptidase n=1 Tax=Psychrilyobacter sp. TaxID=2586924 RepID=UPI003C7735FA